MLKKNVFLIAIIVAVVIAVATWFLYRDLTNVNGDPWEMIPNNAALIIEIDKPLDVANKLSDDNLMWQKLLQVSSINSFATSIEVLDTLLLEHNGYFNTLWNSPLTIAFYPDSIVGVETIILSRTKTNINSTSIRGWLSSALGRDYALLDIAGIHNGFKVVSAINNSISYFTSVNGVFIYSSSVDLMMKVIETFEGKLAKLTDNPSFVKLKQTSGAKVHARAYVQYDETSKLVESLISPEKMSALQWINNFADWTEVDILIKNDELIFSGFSVSTADNNYLSSFEGQQPVKMKALNIIPYNANTIAWIGISNFSRYFNNVNPESVLNSISTKLNYDINKLLEVVGDEIVFASNANSRGSLSANSWVIVKTNNSKKAASALKQIAINTGSKNVSKHKQYRIRKINNTSFIKDIFGDAFAIIKNNYYTFVGDYAVFANSEKALINLTNYFDTGKTLDLNDNFKDFSDNISSQSNMLLYIKPVEMTGLFNEYFANDVVKHLVIDEKVISSFQGIALQISVDNQFSFTNYYVKYSAAYHEENLAVWKVKVDEEIVRGPYLVFDHNTKKQNIIVFDSRSNMYLINPDGSVLWKKTLDKVPISDIYEVDYYKNGKIQYLFNTADFIYLIDKKGRNVSGYPKKLHSKATNGISVFDYLNSKDYRLLLAQSDKRIYNYSIKGDEVKGWSQPRTQNIVIEPVTRLLANNKDYIIITDIDNEIKIVNRKGKRRIKLSGNLNKAKNSDYYVNRTNSKGIIITTNEKGQLVYISSSGKLRYTDFGDFSASHFFLYEDFDGDRSKDFIFIDGNKLVVFDRFKKELFSYQFGSEITIAPKFFTFGKKQHILGVVADKERTIYLFDNDGNIIISKGLVGETPFTVGDLENNNKINLVSAAGDMLYNYRLQ